MSSPDLLVVLGKNIGVGSSPKDIQRDPYHLSAASKVSSIASGILLEPWHDVDGIYSTGVTSDGAPAESVAMRDFTIGQFPGISPKRLHVEDKSKNTAGNAKEVAEWLEDHPEYKVIDLATVDFHLDNAVEIFERRGITIHDGHATDEVLRKHAGSREYPPDVEIWLDKRHLIEQFKERVIRRQVMFRLMDRSGQGRLLNIVTNHTRSGA